MEAYLDNAATTQTFPEVCDIVKRVKIGRASCRERV